jgi:transposase
VLSLPPAVKLFVAREAVDMRKAFDGLAALVRDVLEEDPLSGHLFIFFNRRSDRVKILWWDRSGYWLLAKRLESGTFVLPKCRDGESVKSVRMTSSELALVLDGIDLTSARRRKRYSRDVAQ